LVESVRTTAQLTRCEASGVDQGRSDEMQAATPTGDRHDGQPESAGSASDALARKTVLVVEDDEAVSSLLVALLEDRGYAAVPAMDGRSAIELARKLMPHLITLDLALPGTDGHEVLENLKANPETRDIPVVVISAFTQILPAGDRKKLAYLLGKPFDVTEVLEIVQATVGNPYL
jgi:CheY-like chemotaxis protein